MPRYPKSVGPQTLSTERAGPIPLREGLLHWLSTLPERDQEGILAAKGGGRVNGLRRSELRPRPTVYRGIKMRSRLEAKWAAYWDQEEQDQANDGVAMGWEYEPYCFASGATQYLPDFKITWPGSPLGSSWYCEVKPYVPKALEDLMETMEVIFDSEPDAELYICVGDPEVADTWAYRCIRMYPLSWPEWMDGDDQTVRQPSAPNWFQGFQRDSRAAELMHERNWVGLRSLMLEHFRRRRWVSR